MNTLNNKSKIEQLFLVLILCIGCFSMLCFTGCGGGKSCETVKWKSMEQDGISAKGCSVPGCGGCLTSGKGCDSCLWAQSCKFVTGELDDSMEESDGESTNLKMVGCDIRYYGEGCLGCAQSQKTCYSGFIISESGEDNTKGFFYGSTDSEENMIGCSNGCGGCVGSEGMGAEIINELETEMGLN